MDQVEPSHTMKILSWRGEPQPVSTWAEIARRHWEDARPLPRGASGVVVDGIEILLAPGPEASYRILRVQGDPGIRRRA